METFKHFDVPRQVVLFSGNSGKRCHIRHSKFPEPATEIFHQPDLQARQSLIWTTASYQNTNHTAIKLAFHAARLKLGEMLKIASNTSYPWLQIQIHLTNTYIAHSEHCESIACPGLSVLIQWNPYCSSIRYSYCTLS